MNFVELQYVLTYNILYKFLLTYIQNCFRSQELIRKAIKANDFLKHLDQSQVEAIVEAMYSEEYEAKKNIVTEGETGISF